MVEIKRRCRVGEGGGELLAKLRLLFDEMLKAELQIARHHARDAVVIKADQLAQKRDRQQGLAALAAFLLDDDLGQHGVREVIAIFGVIDHEVPVAAHHLGQVFQGHVGAGLGIIQPPVRVLFYDDGFSLRGLDFGAIQHRGRDLSSGTCCTAAAYHTGGAHRQTFLPPGRAGHRAITGRVSQRVAIAERAPALHSLQA